VRGERPRLPGLPAHPDQGTNAMAAKSEIVSAPTTPREAAQPAVTPSRSRIGPHVAGVLSYLVPGLGQIVQGRVAKGLLFFVCIYALFFYGLFLGSGTATLQAAPATSSDKGHAEEPATVVHRVSGSVFLPDSTENLGSSLYNRPQFLAQFWVGIAAWPAIYQYLVFDKNETYADNRLGGFMRQPGGALKSADSSPGGRQVSTSDEDLNAVFTTNDKMMELGWVFSVIAGVLNIMVIYDAVAGPAFPATPRTPSPKPET
jgi:hypothetical protein